MSALLSTNVKELVFVLGVHGSGTTLLAQLLSELDLPKNPLSLRPDAHEKQSGESSSISCIHQRFLNKIGSHWNDPCPLPEGAFQGEEAEEAKRSIQQILLNSNCPKVFIRDPDLCRLLPLWTAASKSFDCRILALEIVRDHEGVFDSTRNPYETGNGLSRRIDSKAHSDLLWWRHVSEARRQVQGMDFLTIDFNSIENDPRRVFEAIHTFLDISGQGPLDIGKDQQGGSSIFDTSDAAGTDTDRFLRSAYRHLLSSNKPLPEPPVDTPAPSGITGHPWREDVYEAVSAAGLKHLAGTIPQSAGLFWGLSRTCLVRSEQPIEALFISDKPTWPSHTYRVKNPVDALNRHGLNAVWLDKKSVVDKPELLDRALRVITHRLDWGPEFETVVQECRKRRIPVGYDIDDLLFLPELIAKGARNSVSRLGSHEIRRWIRRSEEIQRCLRETDFFIGATPSLTAAAEEFNPDCRFICNGFSPENLMMANLAREFTKPAENESVTVGYASGSATHEADFDEVAATIWQLMNEDPRILLTIVGPLEWETRPPQEIENRITIRPLVPHVNLPFELARFDINIAPLERNDFCDAKSPLKFFEAGLVGVPTLATANPTYEHVSELSPGCLIANDQAAWYEHLRLLSSDSALRENLGEHARRTAIENFHSDLSVGSYEKLPRKAAE